MKNCTKCGEEKPLDSFYNLAASVDGKSPHCIECDKIRKSNYYQTHKEYKARKRDEWRAANRERVNELERNRIKRNREAFTLRQRKYISIHKVEHCARTKANQAIKSGKIARKSSCEKCGSATRLHKHHSDYSRPLEVVWLCPMCHNKIHRMEVGYTAPNIQSGR